ncbi:MAG: hypothetical protein ACTSQP_24055, partial [Promethearchaeota archaeon]
LKSSNKELTIQIVDDGVYLDYNPEDISDFYNKLINKEISIEKGYLIFFNNGNIKKKYKISSIEFDDKIYLSIKEFENFTNDFIISQQCPELVRFKSKLIDFINKKVKSLERWLDAIPSKKIKLLENEKMIYSSFNEKNLIKKPNLDNSYLIICSADNPNYIVEPDQEFTNLILSEVKNNRTILKILHIMEDIDLKNPFRINSIIIFNKIKFNENYKIVDECILRLLYQVRDKILHEIIRILRINVLVKFIENKYIKFFFQTIMNSFELSLDSKQYYDKESEILEFKSKRLIENKSEHEIMESFQKIARNYSHFTFKFIIIGIEDDDIIDGIDGKFVKSDLIGKIEREMNTFLDPHGKKSFIQHIKLNYNKFLIIFIIY